MPTALVTGATGILGREIVLALGRDSQTWSTVWALSRSKKGQWPSNVQSKQLDLQASAEDMAKELGDAQPEYIFFTAYLEQDSEEKATQVNGAMLENFLSALEITGASKKVKRVVLTTGAKQYGVHLGTSKMPMEESDARLADPDRPPNFYYKQQDILMEKGEKQGWDWVVTYPNEVVGVAKGNFMNLATTLGIYCAITKELGEDLMWPGSPDFYTSFLCYTSSRLHAAFNLWAALEDTPAVSNQAFNVINGDVESWQNMWPKLAKKYGLRVPEKMFTKDEEQGKFDEDGAGSVMKLMERPPLAEFAAQNGLKDSKWAKQSQVEAKINMMKWSQRKDVRAAWDRLAESKGLEHDSFEKAPWCTCAVACS